MNLRPWWQESSIRRADNLIKDDWTILEFGSGRSTIWLAQRAAYVISIEHDVKWFDQVKGWARQMNLLPKIDLRLWPAPYHLQSYKLKHLGNQFDMIIVDGAKPRPHNAQTVYNLLKDGGIFVVDDSERLNYQRIARDLDPHWACLNPKPDHVSKQPDGKWTRMWVKDGDITKIHVGDDADLKLMDLQEGLEYNKENYTCS